jgi:hypothetical protein
LVAAVVVVVVMDRVQLVAVQVAVLAEHLTPILVVLVVVRALVAHKVIPIQSIAVVHL